MKRRTRPVQKTGKSPYAKYGKKPHRYSAAYYEWRARQTKKAIRAAS